MTQPFQKTDITLLTRVRPAATISPKDTMHVGALGQARSRLRLERRALRYCISSGDGEVLADGTALSATELIVAHSARTDSEEET